MSKLLGMIDWGLQRDKEGHRDYLAKWLIESGDPEVGPATVFLTPGLPLVGAYWAFGTDLDLWAHCHPDWKVSPVLSGEPGELWTLEQKFSTRPIKRCQDSSIENPLDEPPDISGSFTTYTQAAVEDRNGKALKTSSLEMFTGSATEFDDSRPDVKISMNTLFLPLGEIAAMMNTVNDAELWGLEPRKVKLSKSSWQRQIYGTCNYYYKTSYDFEINRNTWDRRLLDEGTRILRPGLDPDAIDNRPISPQLPDGGTGRAYKLDQRNFIAFKDDLGENARCLLDGNGQVHLDIDNPVYLTFEKYEESNFLTLGVPSSLT